MKEWLRKLRHHFFGPTHARHYANDWAQARRERQLRPFIVDTQTLFTHGID